MLGHLETRRLARSRRVRAFTEAQNGGRNLSPHHCKACSSRERYEGRSDELHDQGLKDLFVRHGGAGDAMAYMIGSEIYGELEKVVDRFEDVANEISGIVIENV